MTNLLTAFLILIWVGFATELNASEPHQAPFARGAWHGFEGTLGKAKVSLAFYVPENSNQLTGNYCYTKYDNRIQLSGNLKGNRIQLSESYQCKPTGTFSGQFIDGDFPTFNGVWNNTSGDKTIDFTLRTTSTVWGDKDSQYSLNISDIEVETFMKKVKKAIQHNDSHWLAAHTHFPIKVSLNGNSQRTTIKNKKQFKKHFTAIFDDTFKDKVAAASVCNLFSNAQGVMLGDGAIWIAGDSIIAINN